MNFGKWNDLIHNEYEQIKRIAFMLRIKSENVCVMPDDQTAQINGTEGIYNVTLDSCTCYDFVSRELPCKHVYRLAYELGKLNDLPKVDRRIAKSFQENIPNEIERYKEFYLNGAISIEKFIKIANALQSK